MIPYRIVHTNILHVQCALSIGGLQLLHMYCTLYRQCAGGPLVLKFRNGANVVQKCKNFKYSICVQVQCLRIFPLCSWNTANNSFLSIHSSLFGSYFFISYFASSHFEEFLLHNISIVNIFRYWTVVHWHLQDKDNFLLTFFFNHILQHNHCFFIKWLWNIHFATQFATNHVRNGPTTKLFTCFLIENCPTATESGPETHGIELTASLRLYSKRTMMFGTLCRSWQYTVTPESTPAHLSCMGIGQPYARVGFILQLGTKNFVYVVIHGIARAYCVKS